MKCDNIEDLALLRQSGEASPAQLAELVDHLLTCSECCRKVTGLDEVVRLYHQYKAPVSTALPLGVRARVLQEVTRDLPGDKKSIHSLRLRLPAAVLGLAASILFIFLIIMPQELEKNGTGAYGSYAYIFGDETANAIIKQANESIDSANTFLNNLEQPETEQIEISLEDETELYLNTLEALTEELEEVESNWTSEQSI
ncbi:MAG: hypothetical protein JXA52_02460 [Planctomycetes bacterium]|nr:hypothetical protein [Planctomycetota bacterium]